MRRDSLHRLDVHIGKRLKQLRTASKLSLGTVGEIIEVSPQHVSRIERGERKLNAAQFYQLARGLDVPLSWFFTDYREGKDELSRLRTFLKTNQEKWHPATNEEMEKELLVAWRRLSSQKQQESVLKIVESVAFTE